MSDIVIPIVFPDYRITVRVPKTKVDLLPFTDLDNFTMPEYKDRFSNLGHAGVLFINGKNGLTKYYEYGRYDPPANLGIVKKIRRLPDARVREGKLVYTSLKKPLAKISRVSGQSGAIQGVYIEVENKFKAMLNYANKRKLQNGNPKRKPYDLLTNSCIHFVKEVVQQAGVDTPWMIDPRPNSYIGEFRDDFPDLDYKKGKLTIEDIGSF
jgi:hypothetical protein